MSETTGEHFERVNHAEDDLSVPNATGWEGAGLGGGVYGEAIEGEESMKAKVELACKTDKEGEGWSVCM